ncbi:MAG: DUF3501 family protein [Nitrospira sp.]|nr:DUF3501 family protein [Nitrospira sp.]
MQPLGIEDVKACEEYERERTLVRRRVIELKEYRRITVGESISLVFENRDTLLFQIHEILRAEGIVDLKRIQEEVDAYNALLPAAGELSATMFIEITDSEKVKESLDALRGIDQGQWVAICIGPYRINGVFEGGRSSEEKISAVHYVRFQIPEELIEPMRNPYVPVAISIDHPNYTASARVSMKTRFSFMADLGVD